MIFHWSPSDSNFPQVSRTLLSILADLNNAVVCMVSILSLISISPSFFFELLGNVPSITIALVFQNLFSFLSKFKSCFSILPFSLCCPLEQQNPSNDKFFQYWVWFLGQDLVIRLHFNVPENFTSHFRGQILVCAYTNHQHGQVLISFTIASGSSFLLIRAYTWTLFVLVCCIRLLGDQPFHLYRHKIYACYSVAFYLFSF